MTPDPADRLPVIVAGGTGLVGGELLALLAARPRTRVLALSRAEGRVRALPGVTEVVFDFDAPASFDRIGSELPCRALFCCLGTTRKKAGSDEAFRRVDRDYPLALLRRLRALPEQPAFALVSSVGADAPRGLYLKTKHEVEAELLQSGLPHVIVRPSLLLGERAELRLGERIAQALSPSLTSAARALTGSDAVERYAPIEARDVARALVYYTLDAPGRPERVVEGRALRGLPAAGS